MFLIIVERGSIGKNANATRGTRASAARPKCRASVPTRPESSPAYGQPAVGVSTGHARRARGQEDAARAGWAMEGTSYPILKIPEILSEICSCAVFRFRGIRNSVEIWSSMGANIAWPWRRFLLAPGQISRNRFLACTIRFLGNFQEICFF